MSAYTHTVPMSTGQQEGGAPYPKSQGKRTRRPSSPAETARRKAAVAAANAEWKAMKANGRWS